MMQLVKAQAILLILMIDLQLAVVNGRMGSMQGFLREQHLLARKPSNKKVKGTPQRKTQEEPMPQESSMDEAMMMPGDNSGDEAMLPPENSGDEAMLMPAEKSEDEAMMPQEDSQDESMMMPNEDSGDAAAEVAPPEVSGSSDEPPVPAEPGSLDEMPPEPESSPSMDEVPPPTEAPVTPPPVTEETAAPTTSPVATEGFIRTKLNITYYKDAEAVQTVLSSQEMVSKTTGGTRKFRRRLEDSGDVLPSEEELETLIENTYNFYSLTYQDAFDGTFLEIDPIEVDIMMVAEDITTIAYEYTAAFSSVPNVDEFLAATTNADQDTYLTDFVQVSGPYFSETEAVTFAAAGEETTDSTGAPTTTGDSPTMPPTAEPTVAETTMSPTSTPTAIPTALETESSTVTPTGAPTTVETTVSPTATLTTMETESPTATPTASLTVVDTTMSPTAAQTSVETDNPTTMLTGNPTVADTTTSPTAAQTTVKTESPTAMLTDNPTVGETMSPTAIPTATETGNPTATPTSIPTGVTETEPPSDPPTESTPETPEPTAGTVAETAGPTACPGTTANVIGTISFELDPDQELTEPTEDQVVELAQFVLQDFGVILRFNYGSEIRGFSATIDETDTELDGNTFPLGFDATILFTNCAPEAEEVNAIFADANYPEILEDFEPTGDDNVFQHVTGQAVYEGETVISE